MCFELFRIMLNLFIIIIIEFNEEEKTDLIL